MELKKDKLKEMKRREGAVVRHVSGISCKTDITELAHSTESPFFGLA